MMVQSHTDPEDLYPGWSRYCHTSLDLFTAAAAGWDPISSKDHLNILLTGSETDKKLSRHLSVAGNVVRETDGDEGRLETHTSFDILRDLFDLPSQPWAESQPYIFGGTKRRANSPPQGDEAIRRTSTDNLSLRSSASGYSSGTASSFATINSAYGTLDLDSPFGRHSPARISSSSTTSGDIQPYTHGLDKSGRVSPPTPRYHPIPGVGKVQGFNKDEAERHQKSLHVRRHRSCPQLSSTYDRSFHELTTRPGEADTYGYSGEELV